MILALETATNICSVAFQNKEGAVFEKRTERKGSHSELLFIFVRELMEEHAFKMSDLDEVLVSSGPGSYTGLRIAASGVKGMFFGLDVAIFAGNTLAGFAQTCEDGTVHAVINARRKHLYYQQFKRSRVLEAISGSTLLELTEIESKLNSGDQIIGTGIGRLSEKALETVRQVNTSQISAKGLLDLFNSSQKDAFFVETTAEELESNYLTSSQVNNTKI